MIFWQYHHTGEQRRRVQQWQPTASQLSKSNARSWPTPEIPLSDVYERRLSRRAIGLQYVSLSVVGIIKFSDFENIPDNHECQEQQQHNTRERGNVVLLQASKKLFSPPLKAVSEKRRQDFWHA